MAAGGANPVLVEVVRGGLVESHHRGAVAVVDAAGRTVLRLGDIDAAVYPRSALKPIQALPLVESGAADAFHLDESMLALACASHGGEPGHVDLVLRWLGHIGLDAAALECGAHVPSNEAAAQALLAHGIPPTAAHNNCSGKHTGFLTVARHLGVATQGYVAPGHPAQSLGLETLAELAGVEQASLTLGIDGCSAPNPALPLERLALAMARVARPDGLPPARTAAARRLVTAMKRHPWLVGGTGRLCTRLIPLISGGGVVKVGAEGVYVAILPELGLGAAIKIDDGAGRAADLVIASLLDGLGALDPAGGSLLSPVLTNWRGTHVGELRLAAEARSAISRAGTMC